MSKPNILFIQVDQMTPFVLSAYGGSVCRTPTLDGLVENGVVFDNAYCNFPLCAPSRFSMATGQLCSAIGAYDNAAECFAEIPTYAHYLRQLGYQTSLSGKMHFIGPDQFHGFERRLTADLYPADFSWVPNWGNEGKRDTNDSRSVTVAGLCERSVQIDFDETVTQAAVQHLYDIARGDDGRPFFMQVSYTHPHEPYLCTEKFWNLYSDDDIPMPDVGALSEDGHDAHSVRLLKDFAMWDRRFADAEILRARRAYYGAVSYVDSLLARLLVTLKNTGLDGNTAILFSSDHGEMLGERGMWFKKHFYEHALRVPLFLCAPWIKAQRVSELVSLVDLLPTFNALASGGSWSSSLEPLAGTDLTALLDRGNPQPTRPVYAEYLAEATPVPMFMIRRGNYKFVYSSHDGHLLFDLVADPQECTNLANRSEHVAQVEALAAEVRAKWDEPELHRRIVLSQRRRGLVRAAMKTGAPVRWNHDESPTDDSRWYRGVGGYNEWAFDYLPVRGRS